MATIETTVGEAKVIIEDALLPGQKGGMRDTAGNAQPAKVDDLLKKMGPVLEGVASVGTETLAKMPSAPDEVSLSFGMGYSAKLDAWIVKGDASLSFNVQVKWKKPKDAPGAED